MGTELARNALAGRSLHPADDAAEPRVYRRCGVARRINEIGIRMALGATRSDVIRMVLGDALGMVCVGLAVGAPIAYWGKTFAASLIQDLPVNSAAPIVFGAVAMIAVALLAAWVPARRAANVDPMEALRHE